MKEIKGLKPAKMAAAPSDKLPAGGYIAKIVKAEVIQYSRGEMLAVNFDIADGEHKGHFTARFKADANSDFGQKWKGVYRLTVDRDGDLKPFELDLIRHFAWALETSNAEYEWDWDETKLKGKWIGVLFRNREWEKDGRTGWTTECCAVTSAQAIRAGDFEIPKDRPLKKKAQDQSAASAPASSASAPAQQDDGIIAFDGDEIPF